MSNRGDKASLTDILDCIQRIEDYTRGLSYDDFMDDDRTEDAVIRNLEVIGEAIANISKSTKEKYTEVQWGKAIGMRDRLIHGYIHVNYDIVWETVREDLPELKEKIKHIIEDMK